MISDVHAVDSDAIKGIDILVIEAPNFFFGLLITFFDSLIIAETLIPFLVVDVTSSSLG